MSDAKKPWGDAYAIKPARDADKDQWLQLGPVWESERGNFSFTLDLEPLHWRQAGAERRIIITRRQPAAAATPPVKSRGK